MPAHLRLWFYKTEWNTIETRLQHAQEAGVVAEWHATIMDSGWKIFEILFTERSER